MTNEERTVAENVSPRAACAWRGLGERLTQALDEFWPGSGVNGHHLADLIHDHLRGGEEVARHEAWAEGRESLGLDFAKPIGEDGMRPSTPNPYQGSTAATPTNDGPGMTVSEALPRRGGRHDIKAGSVWRSRDSRDNGRTVTVVSCGSTVYGNDYITVKSVRHSTMRVRTLLERYDLLKEAARD